MTRTPTPEEFLAATEPDDEEPDAFTAPIGDPLESIAHSLHRLTEIVVRRDSDDAVESGAVVPQEEFDELARAHDDLEAKCEALTGLVDEVLAVVKPSVSKVANQVRETVAAWREGQVPQAEPEPVPVENDVEMGAEPPSHDAPVFAWRGYARSLGYNGPDIDSMNRSQIRTMLGIEHGEEASS